jgi:hypothetical protein
VRFVVHGRSLPVVATPDAARPRPRARERVEPQGRPHGCCRRLCCRSAERAPSSTRRRAGGTPNRRPSEGTRGDGHSVRRPRHSPPPVARVPSFHIWGTLVTDGGDALRGMPR